MHIQSAFELSTDATDKDAFQALDKLAKDYVAVSGELAAAAKDYGDTVSKVTRANDACGVAGAVEWAMDGEDQEEPA